MGNILRSLSAAGYEVRRVAQADVAPESREHFDELGSVDVCKVSSEEWQMQDAYSLRQRDPKQNVLVFSQIQPKGSAGKTDFLSISHLSARILPLSKKCQRLLVTDDLIRQASGLLFRDKHYTRAVEEAFKCLNNAVKDKSGLTSTDGAGLMKTAFSANSPVLKLNSFQTRSEKDEQLGYMDIFAGSMTGIRNPRAHENSLTDDRDVALELLVLANHLMRKLDNATK